MSQGSRKRYKQIQSKSSGPSGVLYCNYPYANDHSESESKADINSPSEPLILRRIYDTLDENGDEKLTIEEIRGFLNKLRMQMLDEDVESIDSPLSTSDDGSLKFKQFISLYDSLWQDIGLSTDHEKEAESPDDLMEAFRVFDKNGDGYISSHELQHSLHSLGLAQGRDLADYEEMICKFDLDSNGILDFSEFKIIMMMSSIWSR